MPRTIENKAQVYREINELVNILKEYNAKNKSCLAIERLESLKTQTKNKNQKDGSTWDLSCRLIFKGIDKNNLKIPDIVSNELIDIILTLNIKITEVTSSKNNIRDCILRNKDGSHYSIQVIMTGKTKKNKSYKIAWHLDKHIRSANQQDGIGKGFIHPEYHFNMGGFGVTKNIEDYGEVLMVDTPRLIHPPLDIILSIDFVLRNFYGVKVLNLLKSNKYKKLVKASQKRLWRPYFIALANYWDSHRFNDLEIDPDYADKILGFK